MTKEKRPEEGGERTVLSRANDSSYSLRTTVPKGIVKQFVLKVGDVLIWRIKPSPDGKGLQIFLEKESGAKK